MNPMHHILYVDDSSSDRDLVRRILQRNNTQFSLTEAASRRDVETLMACGQFDLVLSDFNIGGFHGLQIIDTVKAQHPHTPVVILTGTGSAEIAVEAMKRGAADYLLKTPNQLSRLPDSIQTAIEQTRLKGEQDRVEKAARRIFRARRVMAECNHALVHANAEAQLLREMCRIMVEVGGYRMAWIGYVDEGARCIRPVARAGEASRYLSELPRRRIDHADGDSPAAIAIRSGRPCVVTDVTAADAGGWRQHALNHGYFSVTSLPLKDGNRVFGALTIYEAQPHEFGPDQITMFEELANDIAYGITGFRTEIARVKADQALIETEQKLAGILDSIDNIVWSASSTEFLYINAVAERIYGRPLADFYRNRDTWFSAIHPHDQPKVRAALEKLRRRGALVHEYRIVRPDGSIRWLEDKTKAVYDSAGRLLRIDGVASDISERKNYEAHIKYMASHDALTGLANRNLLADRLAQAMLHAQRKNRMLALLVIDLDRFKDINDSVGHAFGDALLKEAAVRLQQQVRKGDTVSRQGGDEFIILLSDLNDAEGAAHIAAKILRAFAQPFTVGNQRLHITPSIGATVYPGDGADSETLLQNADIAMYRAKREVGHGNGFQFYSLEMSIRTKERIVLGNALRRAVEREEFELYYQPKIDLRSGELIGAEALIRWRSQELGMIPPSQFIPLAEEIGLIVPIGSWVLHTACRQNKAWQDEGLRPITVSVNLSAHEFRQPGLAQSVAAVLGDSDLDARFIELELTESMVMGSAEQFGATMRALKELGVELSIDDFGTGYSCLSYLKRFPLDRLKIDRSFVRDLATDPDDAAIVRLVISLGHSLNLRVIAEGVESNEQLQFLRDAGCDEMQGNLYSEPLPADRFRALLMRSGSMPDVAAHR
ncbi:EAL domain-containing protein [Noviherbaspirillum sp.]|uniref:EAL domain-containing protein n=1 Tax=Noviherbaspirillum sp. TaxID=1926288 RepID=UPI002FDF514F